MTAPRLTAIIIARNAERIIPACVTALRFCDEILVAVNQSHDQTLELARLAGASVQEVVWEGFGATKNKLITGITTGWILSMDADEIIGPECAEEIRATLAQPNALDGYLISRQNYFLGRKIRHCGWSPDWQLRLFRAGSGIFQECFVHEALQVTGRVGKLRHQMDHFSYPNLPEYIKRMNEYTTLAAKDRVARKKSFSRIRLVGDPVFTFLKMYILKFGFLDGFPGLVLCLFSSLNTLVKYSKHWESLKPPFLSVEKSSAT